MIKEKDRCVEKSGKPLAFITTLQTGHDKADSSDEPTSICKRIGYQCLSSVRETPLVVS